MHTDAILTVYGIHLTSSVTLSVSLSVIGLARLLETSQKETLHKQDLCVTVGKIHLFGTGAHCLLHLFLCCFPFSFHVTPN